MESHTFRHKYILDETPFRLFFASDIHGDEAGFNREQFSREFERAKADGARININGDVFGAILPQDIKRYSRGSDENGRNDAIINILVEKIEKLFIPYVDNIDMIGCGNHETAVLKYHATDMTKLLIGFLNRRRNQNLRPIVHGGYQGFIRYVFEHEGGGRVQTYTLFYNHGQGVGAEVTDGIIDAKRRQYVRSDCIWLGHKHRRWAHEIEPEIGVDRNGSLYEKKRFAIMTGSYLINAGKTDASKNGYRINYAEERMRTPQGTGGIRANLIHTRDGLLSEYIV